MAEPDTPSEAGTGQPTVGLGGLSVPLGVHIDALREADLRFDAERDRRYAEVATEREKALKIKEQADEAALKLQREFQTERDKKANELREQIGSERNLYATKDDLAAAIREIVASRTAGLDRSTTYILALAAIIAAIFVGHPWR